MDARRIYDKLKFAVHATRVENKNKLESVITPKYDSGSDSLLVSAAISGAEENVHIDNATITIAGIDVKPDTRVIAGSGRMGKAYQRFDLASTPFAIESEAFLIFRINRSEYLLIGLLSWNIFAGSVKSWDDEISVSFPGDGKLLEPGRRVNLEDIAIIYSDNWQDALERYADILAKSHRVTIKNVNWRGWGSWDYYADKFGANEILENYNFIKQQNINANIIQIDDGYSVWGDWLDVKKDTFPDGMGAVTSQIAEAGFSPGLWLAPFLAHKDSKLFAEHPDWFLYDADGKPLTKTFVYYALDYSLDAVCDWIHGVLRTIKDSWKIKYFKLDFLGVGVQPCRSAVDGVTPQERFHRCFKSIKSALGDDVYILGCSAVIGPCVGYVNGVRSGPDVSPQYSEIKNTANASAGHWHLDKRAFNRDVDYLVLRSTEDEDATHCGKGCKSGTLSLTEARTWADYVAISGNAIISSDKLSSLRPERFEIFKAICQQPVTEKSVPLDLWDGDANYVPSLFLSRDADAIRLTAFNWTDNPVEMTLTGFENGESLIDSRSNETLNAINKSVSIKLGARASTRFTYAGSRSYDELRYQLSVMDNESKITFESIIGADYEYEGEPVEIPLGARAQCPMSFNRLTALGMSDGACSELLSEKRILGIPFYFTADHRAIKLSSSDTPYELQIDIGRKARSLYILHSCAYPVKGALNSYIFKYRDKSEETEIIVGDHIGNSEAIYSQPWKGHNARVAWHNQRNDACLYLMEWRNPRPDETIEALEITWPRQRADIYIAGITGIR